MLTSWKVIHCSSQTLNVTSVRKALNRSAIEIDIYKKSMKRQTTNAQSARKRSNKIQAKRDTWRKSMKQTRITSSVPTVRKPLFANLSKHVTLRHVFDRHMMSNFNFISEVVAMSSQWLRIYIYANDSVCIERQQHIHINI